MRVILFVLLSFTLCPIVHGQKYLFYLHGKIVEDQGIQAKSTQFGSYEYTAILDTFRKAGFTVMSEVRKPNTDVKEYAHKTVHQIDSLIKKGINPSHITVLGASKGAVIAMLVSSFLKNEKVNFVFMAGCNDGNLSAFPEINFCGNILSIHEKSDDIGLTCDGFKSRSSNAIAHYKEIEINTGLHHGFLYKPLPGWVKPAIKWANGGYE